MPVLISTYSVDGNKVRVSTPYCETVVETCRSWGGKFQDNCWVLSAARLPQVQAELGQDASDPVEVEVAESDYQDSWSQLRLGWYVLASRRQRDWRADIYAELVAGNIPKSGGSVKNPRVMAEDAVFRLWVPRDFALARNLNIVTDPKAGQAVEESGPLAAFSTDELLAELERRGCSMVR